MKHYNHITLLGEIVEAVSMPQTRNIKHHKLLTIKTRDSWKKEIESYTTHRVLIYNNKMISQYFYKLKPGTGIFVEGTLRNREWTGEDGRIHYMPEIIVPWNGIVSILGEKNE